LTGYGEKRHRRARSAGGTVTTPALQPRVLPPATTPDGVDYDLTALDDAAMGVLADVGIACRLSAEVIATCVKAGLAATPTGCIFPRERVRDLLALAPRVFTHVARDQSHSLNVSSRMSVFGPALSAEHFWEGQARRPMTTADASRFSAVAEGMSALGLGTTALHLSAPDASAGTRLAAFANSNYPLIAPAGSSFHARDLIAAARAGRARTGGECQLMIAAPVTDALTFDHGFTEALAETGHQGEGLIIAPVILIGANAPATRSGALVRFAAETLGGIALAQAIRPGHLVATGATIAGVSMRNGLPLIGTADAVATLGGAVALARRWNLAFYAFGPGTNAKGCDALAAAETARWLTAAYHLGANAIIGAIGAVDLDDGVSLEKLVIDAEAASALNWPAELSTSDPGTDLRNAGAGGMFLGTDAARQLARNTHDRMLDNNQLFESWLAAGSPALSDRIAAMADSIAPRQAPPDAPAAPLLDRRAACLADLASGIYSRSIRDAFGFKA
jgi:trimethylamine---corrinoid protein Co-methyltransferase